MKNREFLNGLVIMICSSIAFSVMSGLVRYASHIDPFKTSLFRFAVGLALLGLLALLGRIKLEFYNHKILFLRGLLGGLAVFFFYMSINKIGIAKGTVISYTYPIFATVGGVVWLGEKVGVRKWIMILASLAGIYLISVDPGENLFSPGLYEILAITGSVCAGVAVVCVKKLRETDSSFVIYFAQCAFGFWLVSIPANVVPCQIGIAGGVVLVGIGLTAAAAQLMMTFAYRTVPVSTGSLVGMLTPVGNILLGLLIFNEEITTRAVTGIIIVLAACTGVIIDQKQH